MEDRRTAGFTLLEILVVVMIIGMLMAVIANRFLGRAQEAQVTLAATQLRQIEQALEMYRLDNGRYPTEEQGLRALVREPESEPAPRNYPPGGYLKSDGIRDPWSLEYEYIVPGQYNSHSFDLFSYGPDGAEGGEAQDADIVNWDLEAR